MKLSEFKFGGSVTVNEDIDFSLLKEDQLWSLNQNIMHVNYDSGLLLDIGWTNEFEVEGLFQVNIINEGDWDRPVLRENISFDDLPNKLHGLIEFIDKFKL